SQALELNTTGYYNTANGADALFSNTTGNYNVALGFLPAKILSLAATTSPLGTALASISQPAVTISILAIKELRTSRTPSASARRARRPTPISRASGRQ